MLGRRDAIEALMHIDLRRRHLVANKAQMKAVLRPLTTTIPHDDDVALVRQPPQGSCTALKALPTVTYLLHQDIHSHQNSRSFLWVLWPFHFKTQINVNIIRITENSKTLTVRWKKTRKTHRRNMQYKRELQSNAEFTVISEYTL